MDNRQIADQLLKEIPENVRQQYKSYLTLHLKELLTQLSKNQIENYTDTKKKSYECQLKCYKRINFEQYDEDKAVDLRHCILKCKEPVEDVKKFLDNINYLSQRKFQGCSKQCDNTPEGFDPEYYKNICLWGCYNRLDKRYIKYWKQHKQKLLERYS